MERAGLWACQKEERLVLGVCSDNKVERLNGSHRMPWIIANHKTSVHYCSHNAYFITLKVKDKGLMSQMPCNYANAQSNLTTSIPSVHLRFRDQIRRHEICIIYIAFPEEFSFLYKHDVYWHERHSHTNFCTLLDKDIPFLCFYVQY